MDSPYSLTQHFNGGTQTELQINLDFMKINPIGLSSDASAHDLYTKFYVKDGNLWASVISDSVERIHDFMSFIFK